jgi:Tautomerase enzyme
MPLVRIDLRKGKQAAYREAISRIVHEALVSVGVPKDDRFQVISEHDSENFVFDPNYLDIRRTEDLVITPDHLERGPDGRAEEGALQGNRRGARGHTQPPSRGRLYWPRRGQKGELVVRQWGRSIRLSYWQMR